MAPSPSAPSPSKKMPAFGASPGPKRILVTAAASASTPAVAKKLDTSQAKAKSSGSGGKGMFIAALAVLALAAAVARWLSGDPSALLVDDLTKTAPPPVSSAATEVAFDAADPDSMPLPGLHVDGGNNAPRNGINSWPALVRVERQRLKPRKRGAIERAVEELSALGVAKLVDESPDTPWDVLIPSKIGGLERLRINKLRKGQQVGTLPEPLSSRKNLAVIAARSGWPNGTVPRAFQLMSEYQDWLDSGATEDFPAGSRWIIKSSSAGHPRNGHESHSSLSTAASATMLPQATFELAQLEVPPPHPPTAGAPQVFGARHQLKLFVAVTSVQPPRAYVYDGGVLTLREREAIVQAVTKTGMPKVGTDEREGAAAASAPKAAPKVPPYAHWMGPWNADATGLGADAVAKQAGRKGARRLRARAEEAATSVFRWLSLPGRLGDPHGDLQFSIAPGSAFEIFSVETVFSPAADAKNETASSSSTSSASSWVVDIKPAYAERLGADIDFLLSPSLVANAASCDPVVVGALRSGLEMQLRRREREQAKEAGACDDGGGGGEGKDEKKGGFSSPKSWSSPGDPCSHSEEDDDGGGGDEAWEAEQARLLGWRRLDLSGSSAPKSLLDRSPEALAAAAPKRTTPRDAASIQAAAEALARAVNGDVRV